MRLLLAAALALLAAAPCAAIGEGDEDAAIPEMMPFGGLLLFYDATGPMSFVTMTPKDVPADAKPLGEVVGVSCQRGLSIPLGVSLTATSVSSAYGDGGFKKAVAAMRQDRPDLAGIYDVKTDLRVFAVLNGLYKSLCTQVTARGFALPPALPAKP